MRFLSRIANRLHTAVRYVETPQLLAHYPRNISTELFQQLNQHWFRRLNIGTVLDIGANTGQFAVTIRAVLPQVRLYSFEPLPDCFAQLQERMKGVAGFTAFNAGLGETSGELTFERSEFAPSSSFLKMAETHKTEFPYTRDGQQIKVRIERLDMVAETLEMPGEWMLKIDVQGYEDRVLSGGEQTVKQARLLLIETSFETLYEGQSLFPHVCRRLTDWGFRYVGALDQLCSPHDGRVLQADSLFIR